MNFPSKVGRIAVNIRDTDTLKTSVAQRFARGEGFALATINLDHLVKLATDQSYGLAYQAQDFVVADGNPVVWLSRLARSPVTLMQGSELVVPLAQMAAEAGVSVALIGSTSDALDKAAEALFSEIPNLDIAAKIAPPFGFDPLGHEADIVLDQAQASGARLCFLALGAPKQETLAARGRARTPTLGFASIGAGLDFLAGTQTRAPKWVRFLALEWLWRALRNPFRLGVRYVLCFGILPKLAVDALWQRTS